MFKKGNIAWDTGIKRPPFDRKWKENMRKGHLGKSSGMLGKHHMQKTIEKLKKWKPTPEQKIKMVHRVHRGERHWNWKGGINPLRDSIRHLFQYRQWRSDVFTRDNYTCQICGIRSGKGKVVYLEADHYPKTFSEILEEYQISTLEEALDCEELWNINNGRTLCKSCHNPTRGIKK